MIRLLLLVFTVLSFGICSAGNLDDLQRRIADYAAGKDANIGVAVIVDSSDTLAVNGNRPFPMLSVYKLPIALAYIDKIRNEGVPFKHEIRFKSTILQPGTYSPMKELFPMNYLDISSYGMPSELILHYMLSLSDNNASDIIISKVRGAAGVQEWLDRDGHNDIHVRSTEREMYRDNSLAYINSSTPLAMARFVDSFDTAEDDSYSLNIRMLLENVKTGTGRLAAGLGDGAILGHKTGTGFTLPDGRIMAVNDAGYVHLPDGRRYAIAVFVDNSAYSMPDTEAIIAHISKIVYNHLIHLPQTKFGSGSN